MIQSRGKVKHIYRFLLWNSCFFWDKN